MLARAPIDKMLGQLRLGLLPPAAAAGARLSPVNVQPRSIVRCSSHTATAVEDPVNSFWMLGFLLLGRAAVSSSAALKSCTDAIEFTHISPNASQGSIIIGRRQGGSKSH